MKIILANGVELNPILVSGSKRSMQGATRDTLEFMFDGTVGLDELSATFTPQACETITIENIGDVAVYTGYTIRGELIKNSVETAHATEQAEAVYADRVTISMGQRTYAETQLASLTNVVDALVLESLMA